MTLATDNPVRDDEDRRIAMHVNFQDPQGYTFVLNNVENMHEYYGAKGNNFEIRIITHGPGLHLLREDTSPVKERLIGIANSLENVSFYACTNTQERMAKAEGKEIEIIKEATMVMAGLAELVELQRAGWDYLKL